MSTYKTGLVQQAYEKILKVVTADKKQPEQPPPQQKAPPPPPKPAAKAPAPSSPPPSLPPPSAQPTPQPDILKKQSFADPQAAIARVKAWQRANPDRVREVRRLNNARPER